MQQILPPHVRQAVDEAWAAKLEQQAYARKEARLERKSATDTRVPVIRRPRTAYVSLHSVI